MNKFQKTLQKENKAIKAQRAKMVAEDLKDAQEEVLRQLRANHRELERKLMELSDLSPDSAFSLKVVKDNFNAKAWAEETQTTKVALAMAEVELKIAEATYTEWFVDEDSNNR